LAKGAGPPHLPVAKLRGPPSPTWGRGPNGVLETPPNSS
jgi:hypothetical protein